MKKRLRPLAFLGMLAAVIAAWAGSLDAQAPKLVKVRVDFRQTGLQSQDAIGGSGRVVITERGTARSSGRFGAGSQQTRVTQSTGIFTVVRDGGESTLVVATQVPSPQVAFFRDYATGAGYVASGVTFQDVGTSLKVSASVLPGNQVRVRLTPMISHFSPDGSGTIEFIEAATELVVPSGRPVALGGATTQLNEVTRQILGVRQSQTSGETAVVLTATVL